MRQIINIIINVTITTGIPLTRRLSSTIVMIEKIPATPRINKLRIVNIYEANYNLLLKYFWPNKASKHASVTNTLDENQWEYIPNRSVDTVTLVDGFIMETHRFTNRHLFKFQNYAKSSFDRIKNNHTIFNSQNFEVPD